MVQIEENAEYLKQVFVNLNKLEAPGVLHFQKTAEFDAALQVCIETNQVVALALGRTFGDAVCGKPIIDGDIFDEKLYTYVFHKDLKPYFSGFIESKRIYFPVRKKWQPQDYDELKQIELLEDPKEILLRAFGVARRVLSRFEGAVAVVCGPISTGTRSVAENFRIFNRSIFKLSQTMEVFTQMPFEACFRKTHTLLEKKYPELLIEGSSSYFFIEHFYEPLFKLKIDWRPHFIFGYKESLGASEEHRIFKEVLHIRVKYLPEGYEKDLSTVKP